MVQCCGSRNDEWGALEVEKSRLSFFCSKPLVYGSAITALAITILGAFALLGCLYPNSSLGTLGGILGQTGAYVILGVSSFFFVSVIAASCCYSHAHRLEKAQTREDIRELHKQPSASDLTRE